MSTSWDSLLTLAPPRRSRRGTPARPGLAQVERLETRCLLDGGASGAALAPPSTFASEAEFQQYLIDSAVAQWSAVLGKSFPVAPYPVGVTFLPTSTAAPVAAGALDSSAPSHSTTNNQVQGVDEGDIVENDGNALYIITGSDLKIVDARNPAALTVASSTLIDGQPIAEYLNGTRLTIISSLGGYFNPEQTDTIPGFGFGWGLGGVVRPPIMIDAPVAQPLGVAVAQPVGVAVGIDPIALPGGPGGWTGSNPQVKITELDVSDPTAPVAVREFT
jgi:hypothetical protein